ncbi:hypothetical protein CDD83_2636 [Cordyceps sp. RAO-2017]|nr:hypothetical protein CDD83_2636 [Cordyceps sp. RAO-2017]
MAWGELKADGQSLSPLTPDLRRGLIAITVLALVSFATSTILFLYLTYKLVVWRFLVPPEQKQQQGELERRPSHATSDFRLGIDGIFTDGDPSRLDVAVSRQEDRRRRSKTPPPNQFLVLIYNLLLADMHQSLAFLLNASWLRADGIMARTPTCFVQGMLVSTGDLSSSMFISTIAVHTYLSVVRNCRPSHRTFFAVILGNWAFVYAISLLPVAVTRNGAERGGFFVRAGAWCWMNRDYEQLRLATHYFFIFLALGVTSALYVGIFVSLRRQRALARRCVIAASQPLPRHEPAFLIYPLIYVMCTLPLALGRIATMAGRQVPLGYFCFAGAIIAFNGSFDCLLFGTTRNAIIFGSPSDLSADDTGLKTFGFLKTPSTRRYGNMIWIQGGGRRRRQEDKVAGGWCSWERLGNGRRHNTSPWPANGASSDTSQEFIRGAAIQMDMVTSVVVEMNGEKNHRTLPPCSKALSATASETGTEMSSLKS